MFIHSKSFFFSLTKEKMMFKLEKRLFYQGKICFFWMVLNDAEKTLRTDSSNHNSLLFFSLQISSSQISSSYRKKIALPLQLQQICNKLHCNRNQTCFMQRQMIWMGFLHALSSLPSSNLVKYTHSPSISFQPLQGSLSSQVFWSHLFQTVKSMEEESLHPYILQMPIPGVCCMRERSQTCTGRTLLPHEMVGWENCSCPALLLLDKG